MNDTPTTNTINQIAPPRGPIKAVRVCFAKYFDFRGRASRSEFWWFFLFLLLSETIAKVLGLHFHTDAECRATPWLDRPDHCFVLSNCTICELWKLAVLLPSYAVVVRRLRDIGRSVWWVLLRVPFEIVVLIPAADDSIWSHVAVFIWMPLLVMMCFRGKSNAVAIHPTNKLRRWFSNRLENRIDRLWLGGVFGVTALVTVLLDARFVGVVLAGYFFFFCWLSRDQICAAHPPRQPPMLVLMQSDGVFVVLAVLVIGFFVIKLSVNTAYFPAFNLAMLSSSAVVLYCFLFKFQRIFSGYHGECLSIRAGKRDILGDMLFAGWLMRCCSLMRPTGALLVAAVLWCAALTLCISGVNQAAANTDFYSGLFYAGLVAFMIVAAATVVLFAWLYAALLSRESRSR